MVRDKQIKKCEIKIHISDVVTYLHLSFEATKAMRYSTAREGALGMPQIGYDHANAFLYLFLALVSGERERARTKR